VVIETERLILRPWRASDAEPFAALNADPDVMEFFPARKTRAESDAQMERMAGDLARTGFGLWALEERGGAPFIGFTGTSRPGFRAHFTPCIEVGWRLARAFWGRGYATEAASAALDDLFARDAACAEVVSMTAVGNRRSRAVMERLGMTRDPADDFDHPNVPPESPVHRHVLYRLARAAWIWRPTKPAGGSRRLH
jgi:ribosomal-protein-alanine N-acetyltransferase